MAADLPENYEHQPAFQFIRDVAVDWDTTRVIAGKIGDYVIVARRERNGPTWTWAPSPTKKPVPLTSHSRSLRRTEIRRRDLRGWAGGELAHESAAGDDLEAPGRRDLAAAHRARPRGRAGDPDPAGALVGIGMMMRDTEGRTLPTFESSPPGPPLGVAALALPLLTALALAACGRARERSCSSCCRRAEPASPSPTACPTIRRSTSSPTCTTTTVGACGG